ncbi:MAG: CBS domain-containing protein, partial [Alphaproteobacteria bacterium]|nr:CBS domain-containing protein [Alphaproteobacteria bacterium]
MGPLTDGADALGRLDAFPYRTTVDRVMSTPLVTVAAGTALGVAAARMVEAAVSSVVVVDPDPLGIVTERDLLRATARDGAAALAAPVGRVMSSPLVTVRADALVAVAIGRMDRLGIRHLVVVDEAGAPVGMLSARTLLKLRARETLSLGDGVATAGDAATIRQVRLGLPALARSLRGDGVPATAVAGALSAVLREATARAGVLALAGMADDGWGGPPAPWCLMVLGSGGRGESLLVP